MQERASEVGAVGEKATRASHVCSSEMVQCEVYFTFASFCPVCWAVQSMQCHMRASTPTALGWVGSWDSGIATPHARQEECAFTACRVSLATPGLLPASQAMHVQAWCAHATLAFRLTQGTEKGQALSWMQLIKDVVVYKLLVL